MKMQNKTLLGLFLFLISLGTVTGYVTLRASDTAPNPFVTQSRAEDLSAIPTVSPLKTVESQTQPSPDGTKKVIMRVTHLASGNREYVFTTMDRDGGNAVAVYTTTLSEGSFAIPFNTWSPDDKYFFIQKDTGDALVFTRSGEPVRPDERFLDVKAIYSQGQRTDTYKIVTGWASPTLLIINTVTPEGTKGYSYWFEVPSKAVIQLSGDF